MPDRERGWMRRLFRAGLAWTGRVLTEPRSELTRWQRRARFAMDLGRYGTRQLREDQAPQMAAALAYRTLFGLLPVLVVTTIVARAIGGFEAVRERVAAELEVLGLYEIRVAPIDDAAGPSPTLGEWILDLLGSVEGLNLTAITWVGLLVLVYSAVSLMVTIEESFNRVYRVRGGRSWPRRVPIYWTVLTLGPLAVGLPSVLNRRLAAWLEETSAWGGFGFLTGALAFGTLWLLLFAVYKWLPNRHVRARSAVWGALVAALLVEVLRQSMGAYVENALSVRQLYGSLGLIPLFMLWVYVLWLVVLFGAEVSSALQRVKEGVDEAPDVQRSAPPILDPTSVLLVMGFVAARFRRGLPTRLAEASQELAMPEGPLQTIIDRLVAEGMLNRLEDEEPTVCLARPPDTIRADRLLQAGFDLAGAAEPTVPLLRRLREAQRNVAAELKLSELAVDVDDA